MPGEIESDSIVITRRDLEQPKVPITYCAMAYVCPTYIESRCCKGCVRYDVCRSKCHNSPDRCGLHVKTKRDLARKLYEVRGYYSVSNKKKPKEGDK